MLALRFTFWDDADWTPSSATWGTLLLANWFEVPEEAPGEPANWSTLLLANWFE